MKATMKQIILSLLLSSCTAQASSDVIYWSDADSGRIGGKAFRIANKDAPETGGVGAFGGAKCQAEIKLGYAAKAYAIQTTLGKDVKIEREYGYDRYDRLVIDLSVSGEDYGEIMTDAGHMKDWPHRASRALVSKPVWCAKHHL